MRGRPTSFLLVLALCLWACGGGTSERRRQRSYSSEAERRYQQALADMDDDNCLAAEPEFRKIRRSFPFSRFAALAELGVADCLLKQGKHAEAIQAFRRFVRFRPSHQRVPYARFRTAEAYFEQVPEDWFLMAPAHERDQHPTREAVKHLRRFIEDFSRHRLVPRARHLMRRATTLLARHELYVARFYWRRDHVPAVVGRLRSLLETYAGSGVEPAAMLLLGRAHFQLGEGDAARAVLRDLIERHPESQQAASARDLLRDSPS